MAKHDAPADQPGEGRLARAPTSHPPIPPRKIGALLVNLGTPDATDYWSMRRYLKEFLSDRRVIETSRLIWWPVLNLIVLSKRPQRSGAAYRDIWNVERNESPLLTITRKQAEKTSAALAATCGGQVTVDFCMRYGNPSTDAAIRRLHAQGCERIVFFPLYPQYAAATTATANDAAFHTLMHMRWQPAIRTVPPYYDHPLYIEALARSVERAYAAAARKPDILVTSYHGLPKSYFDRGDPYYCTCQKTSRLLRERLKWDDSRLVTSFQSRFGPEEWLRPYTVEEVARLAGAGKKNIAVLAPGFSADCVETLEEINGEIRESFLQAGGETFTYIPCLNDDDAHIAMIAAIMENEMAGWI